jgi:hypothetical protein
LRVEEVAGDVFAELVRQRRRERLDHEHRLGDAAHAGPVSDGTNFNVPFLNSAGTFSVRNIQIPFTL